MPFTLNEIAEALEGTIDGDRSLLIERLATIESADEGSITFLSNKRYEKYLASTNASAIIVSRNQRSERKDIAFIRVDDPYHGFLKTLKLFHGEASPPKPGVHQTAFIDDSADVHPEASIGPHVSIGAHSKIGAGTSIGAGAVIEENCVIGDRCVIYPNVSILARTSIGLDSIIHAGTTIGSDGFGFVPTDGMYEKIPQIGGVIIEDNVEIGANCTIDRGTIGNTIIRSGVKLDNLIQIAHNVEIGENTVVAAQSGISGSASLGKNVVIAGQVGLVGHIEIGDRVTVTAQSGVSKSIHGEGKIFRGSPAREIRDELRQEAAIRQLPDLIAAVRELEQLLQEDGEDATPTDTPDTTS